MYGREIVIGKYGHKSSFLKGFFVAPPLEVCLLYNEIINVINMIFILISDMLGLFHPGSIITCFWCLRVGLPVNPRPRKVSIRNYHFEFKENWTILLLNSNRPTSTFSLFKFVFNFCQFSFQLCHLLKVPQKLKHPFTDFDLQSNTVYNYEISYIYFRR